MATTLAVPISAAPPPEVPPDRAPAAAVAPRRAPRRARRIPPVRRLTAVAAVVGIVVTVVLSYLTSAANAHSTKRLLDRQIAQVGSLLSDQGSVMQTELSDVATVAVNTDANPAAFARFAAGELEKTGQSLSLWRISGGRAALLANEGVAPRLPAGDTLTHLQPTGRMVILGVLPGQPTDRLSYALMPAGDSGLLVYAESPLPAHRKLVLPPGGPVDGLDVAVYLGHGADPAHLLEATAPTPISGQTRTLSVPFGAATITLVGASQTPLTGWLSSEMPWILLGAGFVLTAAAAVTLETLSRRRTVAERLAAENQRLYQQQRGIAGALQHALLPQLPAVDGIELAARYLAGADTLDVGGDWYDVIPRGDRCVFVVGDVSGSGLPAATTMASLRYAVRAFVSEGHDLGTVLTELRELLDVSTDHQFATVLLGELDPAAGRLRLVSAGHYPPLLVTAGEARVLDCPVAPPVGVPAVTPPTVAVHELTGPGTLLAFTDGAVERRGEVLDAGVERLRSAAAATGHQPLPELLDGLLRATGDGRSDDTVLLGIRCPG